MSSTNTFLKGWQCPNCNKGWSPMRASCDCVDVKEQSRKDLVEEKAFEVGVYFVENRKELQKRLGSKGEVKLENDIERLINSLSKPK